jgi:hypothetical protein
VKKEDDTDYSMLYYWVVNTTNLLQTIAHCTLHPNRLSSRDK